MCPFDVDIRHVNVTSRQIVGPSLSTELHDVRARPRNANSGSRLQYRQPDPF